MKVRKKKTIKTLSLFGGVCYYDELTRFRASSAAHTNHKISKGVLRHHSTGLVQGVADNFDCNISSVNGLKQTHSLALMMIQSGEGDGQSEDEIPRLKQEEFKDIDLRDVAVVEYKGPKKPNMPAHSSLQKVQSLKVLAMAAVASNIASNVDFEFF